MSDILPFLATIPGASSAPRSLGSALTSVPSPPAHSPWLPQGTQPGTSQAQLAAPEVDTAAIEDAAREQGHADGMAQTAELRATLATAIAAFTTARTQLVAPSVDAIAAAAAAVFTAWTQQASPKDLYAPVIAAWLAKSTEIATVLVTPAHTAAVIEMFGDAPVQVRPDATMRVGDLRLSSATLELSHAWDHKLGDLRDAIAAALEPA